MKARLNNNQGISLVVVLMVMAILLTVIGAGLIFSGINTKVAMNYRTGTRAFNAADTGMLAIALSVTPGTTPSSTPVTLGEQSLLPLWQTGRDGSNPYASGKKRSWFFSRIGDRV